MFKRRKIGWGSLWAPALYLTLLMSSEANAEDRDTAIANLSAHRRLITSAAARFGLNAQHLAAIIFTERFLNFDWRDKYFDFLAVKLGQNASVGFCQIKLKTAYFVEKQLHEPKSVFYPGTQYEKMLPVSQTPGELIESLANDSLNILYAAAYLRIIQSRWSGLGYSIQNRPEILGTLYSMGMYRPDGSERMPHRNPQPNQFGLTVLSALVYLEKSF